MSWAYGVLPDGKEIGYGVVATCEQEGCDEKIDRGLAYVCGGMHEGGEHGCGGYFCASHLYHGIRDLPNAKFALSGQLCIDCCRKWEREGAGGP